MIPTIGRFVHYRLSQQDVLDIGMIRAQSAGVQGSDVIEGGTYSALVVAVGDSDVNLKVFLDGNDTHWAPSRSEGDGVGTWSWPPRY